MAIAKQAKPKKFTSLTYSKEALDNLQLNPDNYPLWKAPKDWTTVRSETVAVRAEEALEMLKHKNPANKIRFMEAWANTLTNRVNRGEYNLMDTIEFDWNEDLGNGEHRLVAISRSNGIALMNVSYGRNPDNYYKYDDNYKRTGGNVIGIHLQMDKKGDTNILSAAASWLILYWSGQSLEARLKIEHDKRIEYINKNPKMVAFLKSIRNYAEEAGKKLPVAESVLLALFTLGAEVNETKTREFIKGVIQDDGLRSANPIKVYHDFLIDVKDAKGKQRVYMSFKVGQGLFALRTHFNGDDIERDGRGEYRLKYNPKKGEKGLTRLDAQQETFFEELRTEMRAHEKSKLQALLNPVTPELTEVTALEGKFFSKTALKGLTKLGINTIADLTVFTEVGLLAVLTKKSVEEIKDVLGALDMGFKR